MIRIAFLLVVLLATVSYGQTFNVIDSDWENHTHSWAKIRKPSTNQTLDYKESNTNNPVTGVGHGGVVGVKVSKTPQFGCQVQVFFNTASSITESKTDIRSSKDIRAFYSYYVHTHAAGIHESSGAGAVQNQAKLAVKINGTTHNSYLVRGIVSFVAYNPTYVPQDPLLAAGNATFFDTEQTAWLSDGNHVKIKWDAQNSVFNLSGQKTDQQGNLSTININIAAGNGKKTTIPSQEFWYVIGKDVPFEPYVGTNDDLIGETWHARQMRHVNGPGGALTEHKFLNGGIRLLMSATGIE
jgi:hypothetical protein